MFIVENVGSCKCWVIVKVVLGGDRVRVCCYSYYLKFYKIEMELESISERVFVFILSLFDLSCLYYFEVFNIDILVGVFNLVVKFIVYKLYYF